MKQNGKTPEERIIETWPHLNQTNRVVLNRTVEASGYISSTSEDLMNRRSARIVFSIATIAAYCLIFYLAPQLPQVMVGWAILLTAALTVITIYSWLHAGEKNGNHNGG